jgi:excisionase family DNA binding protein
MLTIELKLKLEGREVSIDKFLESIALGLSEATIRNYVRQGTLFAVKVGRRVLIPLESLEKALTEGIPSRTRRIRG